MKSKHQDRPLVVGCSTAHKYCPFHVHIWYVTSNNLLRGHIRYIFKNLLFAIWSRWNTKNQCHGSTHRAQLLRLQCSHLGYFKKWTHVSHLIHRRSWESSVQWKNKTVLMRAYRLKQNSEFAGCKTKTISWKILKGSEELTGTTEWFSDFVTRNISRWSV